MAKATETMPKRRTCGCMEVHNRLIETDPAFRARLFELERSTVERMNSASARVADEPITIFVVVHIVHNNAAENISEDQVNSQIHVLNKDYAAENMDIVNVPDVWKGLVIDSGIRFELASADPDGNPTSGITRTKTDRPSFGSNDTVKFAESGGIDAWPTDKYLNIWVCTLSGGLLGYAQFPEGPKETDGVVVRNTALGTTGTATAPFDFGRTTTHEIGHWLNLRHIWGDDNGACTGSDFVDDTPNAGGPNFGKPTFPSISCHNGPNGDMFMNYMDYVDDDAMFMFSAQQVARMSATLEGPRRSLWHT
jgi:Pregnancy-associated plasma protein-A